jgi:hypothetical protein
MNVNRLVHIATGSALLVFSAAAQDPVALDKMKLKTEAEHMVQMKMMGAVRGMTVKNAPYSADEINENTQVLADGTRIHRENKTTVYRDGEGRVRRETPDNITITDPVANVTYILDPKSMTGQKLTMAAGTFTMLRTGPGPGVPGVGFHTAADGPVTTFAVSSAGDGPMTFTVNGQKLDDEELAKALAKAKASGQTVTYEKKVITDHVEHIIPDAPGVGGVAIAALAPGSMRKRDPGESLGTQSIEGVNAAGTRHVMTIDAGAIGNDRPIQVTTESWYSDELQMAVLTKHSDPRTGDETFRVTNIRKGEPGAYLFQTPAGYQISERK